MIAPDHFAEILIIDQSRAQREALAKLERNQDMESISKSAVSAAVNKAETNGTTYGADTDPAVVQFLERARRHGIRVRLFYGDRKTGKSWHEENDVAGTISRSMGPVKVPILIANARSTGGGAILTSSIVAIATAGGNWAYRHPGFELGDWAAVAIAEDDKLYALGYRAAVTVDGKGHANFKGATSLAKAKRYIDFMCGKRMAK